MFEILSKVTNGLETITLLKDEDGVMKCIVKDEIGKPTYIKFELNVDGDTASIDSLDKNKIDIFNEILEACIDYIQPDTNIKSL